LCVIETTPTPRLDEVFHTQKNKKSPFLFNFVKRTAPLANWHERWTTNTNSTNMSIRKSHTILNFKLSRITKSRIVCRE